MSLTEDDTGAPVGARVYRALRDLILTQSLPPGSALREQEITRTLGVSRTPLREALRRLEGESLVRRLSGGGVVVNSVSVEDVVETLHARKLLEGEAAAMAAGRLDPSVAEALRARILALRESARPDREEHWAVDCALHQAIAQASGNKLLCRTIESLKHRSRLFDMRRVPNPVVPVCDEHIEILEAICAGDPERASDAMTRHIVNVRQGILESLMGGEP